ncbi:MAG: SUMF1/EgtB/PvdO family nonheme iron enzyme [Bacteroidales bacterium]
MKRVLMYLVAVLSLASCSNSGNGELVGARKRSKPFHQPIPYGMAFVPQGSYTMGTGDEDVVYGQLHQPKTISVSSFFMDETEITNDEYRQFVHWVRDSIARRKLGEAFPEDFLIAENPKTGEQYDPPYLNWDAKIDWKSKDEGVRDVLEEMYLPEHERYFRKKEIDTRKLTFEYFWIDINAAAKKDFSEEGDYVNAAFANRPQGMRDRSVYVRKEMINVYPDTLSWIADYTYSYNEPYTERYFWHSAYNHYPVVGVNWRQSRAFCIWRTQLHNSFLAKKGKEGVAEYRLPSETEWEWAARGGYEGSPYPWGGPYTTNEKGCFLANFKSNRGNYVADGGLRTLIVGHYPANEFGLYDMAGNVSEWTISAYHPSSYNFTWDMNPNYTYNAKESDPPEMKRKVIRGGSWKDVKYYLKVTSRDYEYQDTAKCFIGFRCLQPYLGRNLGDKPKSASKVYH